MHALSGITIVAFEHAIAAPFCTRQLADLGARVIKIERPGEGDFARALDDRTLGLSSHFVWTNRSKESVSINIKHPKARIILDRLIERADVVVQNLAPGATARLGLSYADLRLKYPRLIVCDISGYGMSGPYANKKAYDLLIQAESGFLSITGTAEEPVKAGCAIADIAAGMYAYSSILAALIERGRTGRGRHIDVSMLESMVEWMGHPLYYTYGDAPPPSRVGASHATIYPYGPFVANDGMTIIFGLQNEREWISFCNQVLERPDLALDTSFSTNSKRVSARVRLSSIIGKAFEGLTSQHIMERLDAAKIAYGRMNTLKDIWKHPQLKARNRWRTIQSSQGPIEALLPPGSAGDSQLEPGHMPTVGQHTESIMNELGFAKHEVACLRSNAVI